MSLEIKVVTFHFYYLLLWMVDVMPIDKGTVNGCIAKTRDCSPSQQKEKERLCENSKLHTT